RTKHIGQASKLRKKTICKNPWIGIHIVDGAPVDADGSEQARVVAGACEVGADAAILKEDGTACVATFNTTVQIVPLVHPAYRRIRLLHFIEASNRLVPRDLAQQCEHAIQDTAVVRRGNEETGEAIYRNGLEPEAVFSEGRREAGRRHGGLEGAERAENNRALLRKMYLGSQCPPEHASHTANQFPLRRSDYYGIAERDGIGRQRVVALTNGDGVNRGVPKPRGVSSLRCHRSRQREHAQEQTQRGIPHELPPEAKH